MRIKEKLKPKLDKQLLASIIVMGWFLLWVFMLIDIPIWSGGISITLTILLLAGSLKWIVDFYEVPIVEERISMDKTVVGQIIQTTDPRPYWGQVTRNYADGVYKREETFTSLEKAQVWLDVVYEEELTKHLLRVGIQEKTLP